MNDIYEDIKNAERAVTKNEQKEHIESLDRTVSTLIQKHGTQNMGFLSEMSRHVSKIKEYVNISSSPIQISPEIISAIEKAAKHPIVQKHTKKSNRPPINSRTLFDFV